MASLRIAERVVTQNIHQEKQALYRGLPVLPGMCVCTYVCMCVCVCVCVCVYYVCTYVCMFVCIYIYIYIYMYVCNVCNCVMMV